MTFASSVFHSPVSITAMTIGTRLLSCGRRITWSRDTTVLLIAVSIESKHGEKIYLTEEEATSNGCPSPELTAVKSESCWPS
jgi:hypothetical protein